MIHTICQSFFYSEIKNSEKITLNKKNNTPDSEPIEDETSSDQDDETEKEFDEYYYLNQQIILPLSCEEKKYFNSEHLYIKYFYNHILTPPPEV